MIYHATIELDIEADNFEDADRQAGQFAQRICDESFCECARVVKLIEHRECARPGCYKRVCYEDAEYCGAACSAQRNEPICTCVLSPASNGPDFGCPVHGPADTCPSCGGSGGGDEPHLACDGCGGSGRAA